MGGSHRSTASREVKGFPAETRESRGRFLARLQGKRTEVTVVPSETGLSTMARQALDSAPKEIVIELLDGWHLEGA